MMTNTAAQIATRHMTRAEKAAAKAAKIAAYSAQFDADLARFQQHKAEIATLRATGASEAAIWQHINGWYDTDPRTSAERAADAEWQAAQDHAADVRQELHG